MSKRNNFYDFVIQEVINQLKQKNDMVDKSNMEIFQATGIINLTETMKGDFIWLPNARYDTESK